MAAIILGSGLSDIFDDLPCLASASFDQIPGLATARVLGHRGKLGLFKFSFGSALVFQGRPHHYEGHSWESMERSVRLAFDFGVRTIFLTNAAGGIGPRQEPGTLMAIRDHIVAMGLDWWRSDDRAGASPYSPRLLELLRSTAATIGVSLSEGVYAGVTGPNYETPAEIRALRILGADAVGMSTVHEANFARSLRMEAAAITCVANRAAGLSAIPLSHAEVLATVHSVAGQMSHLIRSCLCQIAVNRPT